MNRSPLKFFVLVFAFSIPILADTAARLALFGAATMRAGVLPRWAGLLLIVGDVVFGLGSFAGSAATIFEILGAALTCAALVWLGLSLRSGSAASARQPTRVS